MNFTQKFFLGTLFSVEKTSFACSTAAIIMCVRVPHPTSSMATEGSHGEATEGNPLVLPASPCSPLLPTSILATEGNPPRSPGLGKRSAKPLQVYSRRRSRRRRAAHPEATTTVLTTELEPEAIPKSPCVPAGDVAAPAPSPAVTPSNHDAFISKLSRRTAGLLPVPAISKRRKKNSATG